MVGLSRWDIQMMRAKYMHLSQIAPEILRLCDEVERLWEVIEASEKAIKGAP